MLKARIFLITITLLGILVAMGNYPSLQVQAAPAGITLTPSEPPPVEITPTDPVLPPGGTVTSTPRDNPPRARRTPTPDPNSGAILPSTGELPPNGGLYVTGILMIGVLVGLGISWLTRRMFAVKGAKAIGSFLSRRR